MMTDPVNTKRFRVLHTLDDGRKLYLSVQGKLLVMPKGEAEFWVRVSRQIHSISIDEMVYSSDLRFYERRSSFLEKLLPFTRVVSTAVECADAAVDPEAFIVGGFAATTVVAEYRPQGDYQDSVILLI
jgi:hypothetical protein